MSPPPVRLVAGARAGLFSNLGHAAGPAAFLEALKPLSIRRLAVFLGGTVGYLDAAISGAGPRPDDAGSPRDRSVADARARAGASCPCCCGSRSPASWRPGLTVATTKLRVVRRPRIRRGRQLVLARARGRGRDRAAAEARAAGVRGALSLGRAREDLARRRDHRQQRGPHRRPRLQNDVLVLEGERSMFEMVEGAFMARTAAEPTSPLVVSVPHAGLSTAGFEATMTPELDVRCDADLFVDRLYRIGEPDGPEVYVAAQALALRLRPQPRSGRRRAGRGAGAPGAAQRRRPRDSSGPSPPRRPDPGAAADAARVARAHRDPRRVSRRR